MLIVVAWMIRHLSLSARTLDTHPVTSRPVALVLALAMAYVAPGLVDRVEDAWSHGERDAVVDAAATADDAGEPYTMVGEATQSKWTSDSDARPTADEMAEFVGVGNRRFDRLFDELAAEEWDDYGPSISAADRGTCHVFPVVGGEDPKRIQDVTELVRLCYGPAEWTSSIRLDSPRGS
jgi:hypothetical protein